MFRQCTLITFAEDADAHARNAFIDQLGALSAADGAVLHHRVCLAVPGGFNGGDIVWHVHFRDEAGWAASSIRTYPVKLTLDAVIDHADSCAYRPTGVQLREADIGQSLYRALFLSVKQGTAPDRITQFESDTLAMPDYIPEIRNWALSKVKESHGPRGWTHVWEQEFRTIEDLRGPYMASAYHWGFLDRWFDPEHHDFIVDTHLCHSASALEESVIARYDPAAAGEKA